MNEINTRANWRVITQQLTKRHTSADVAALNEISNLVARCSTRDEKANVLRAAETACTTWSHNVTHKNKDPRMPEKPKGPKEPVRAERYQVIKVNGKWKLEDLSADETDHGKFTTIHSLQYEPDPSEIFYTYIIF